MSTAARAAVLARPPGPRAGSTRSRSRRWLSMSNVETARRYLEAAFRSDLATCAELVGNRYRYIDHTKSVVADTAETLLQAQQDDIGAWSDTDFVIERMTETTDGRVMTQFRVTSTHSGTYKGVPPTGVRVATSACNILSFDEQRLIVEEEAYYDDLETMLKLGAVKRT